MAVTSRVHFYARTAFGSTIQRVLYILLGRHCGREVKAVLVVRLKHTPDDNWCAGQQERIPTTVNGNAKSKA
jgi:hypothetical protein